MLEFILKNERGIYHMRTAVICADGQEEVETLTVVDMLRRAGIDADLVSSQNRGRIDGSHHIEIMTDVDIRDCDWKEYDALVIPGGLKGVDNLRNNMTVINKVQDFYENKKLVASICAGPTVLGKAGVLRGIKATCYPGMDKELGGADYTDKKVVVDKNVITGRSLGAAIDFALAIITYLTDEDTSRKVAKGIVYEA